MPKQRETKLVGEMVDAVKERWPDAWVLKVHGGPYQRAGVPDLLICIHGFLVAIEAKAPGMGETEEHARARTTARQDAELHALGQSGAITAVCVSPEEVTNVIGSALDAITERIPLPIILP